MPTTVQLSPDIQKYFWGDNLAELSWLNHKTYITQMLLEKGDSQAISWLFKKSTKEEIRQLLPTLKLSKKSSNFWQIYLS